MALGFGFNKTKVLSSAEKYVQQGKLQNAIAEYEKVIKEDPKDLTVLNTIGDLYARVGQTEQAITYFKKVGDTYASDGFTVKAIAMYKKLTKLSPSAIECVQKLAELYTNQGLYNDARAQYMQVAEAHRRNGSLEQATKIFEKMLELDPENASMQSKLADLYISIGKKDEAKNIYFRSADQLRQRRSLQAADEALGRVLSLEAGNVRAIEMRGQIAIESDDAASAAKYFEQLPDIDKRPDSLRALLQAYLKQKSLTEAEPIARKLLTVHNDDSGITSYAEALISTGRASEAVQLYDEFAERMLAGDPVSLQKLHSAISRVRDNTEALETLRRLFVKAGDTTHTAEVMELLAHGFAQAGNFEQARDLYRDLADLEPENPLHAQNYKQILTKLGEDSAARELSAEEATQAFMGEELEPVETVVEQRYPDSLAVTIQAALTEAELFASYNVPAKAIPPLESAIERAPQDVRINQMLAALYVRVERFAEAAACFSVLQEVFAAAGHDSEAARFAELATRYSARETAATVQPSVTGAPALDTDGPATVLDAAAAEWPAFEVDLGSPDAPAVAIDAEATPIAAQSTADANAAEPHITEFNFEGLDLDAQEIAVPEVAVDAAPTTGSAPAPTTHEFDLSDEWEKVIGATPAASEISGTHAQGFDFFPDGSEPLFEAGPAQTAPAVDPLEAATGPATEADPVLDTAAPGTAQEIIEEACFYLAQAMYTEATAAIGKLAARWPNHSALARLRSQLPPEFAAVASEEEHPLLDIPASDSATPSPVNSDLTFDSGPLTDANIFAVEPAVASSDDIAIVGDEQPAFAIEPASEPIPAGAAGLLSEIFNTPIPATHFESAHAGEPIVTAAVQPEATSLANTSTNVLGDFVLGLEESLGDDFALASPAKTQPATALAMTAAATASVPDAAAPVVAPTAPAPEITPATLGHSDEMNSVLADMFAEFKEDVEEGTETTEDPDTHYNLGVAFKEMGLLDEAIGELQKVAQAIDRGHEFSQTMQAYTWLANCFVEKNVPEASYKWYERALKVAPDEETRTAIHYELACAHEIAGDRRQALSHFMEVYGTNIDYRDVAERIKALKS